MIRFCSTSLCGILPLPDIFLGCAASVLLLKESLFLDLSLCDPCRLSALCDPCRLSPLCDPCCLSTLSDPCCFSTLCDVLPLYTCSFFALCFLGRVSFPDGPMLSDPDDEARDDPARSDWYEETEVAESALCSSFLTLVSFS